MLGDLWAIDFCHDDATVVGMEGPIDIDSLEFATRVKIARISDITGLTRGQVVSRAIEELLRQVMAMATDEQLTSKPVAGHSRMCGWF
jgi:hypothetical protein